jgi:predicted RNA-binding Zn-ribbon protein involved in translation (DUF1610 family)
MNTTQQQCGEAWMNRVHQWARAKVDLWYCVNCGARGWRD